MYRSESAMVEKVIFVDNLLCSACLCVGRALKNITDEQLKQYYLNTIKEIPLNLVLIHPSLCWECTALLRKGYMFKEQVKNSYRILQTYSDENLRDRLLTEVSRPPRLNVHLSSVISIPPSIEVELDVGESVQSVYVKDEETWAQNDGG